MASFARVVFVISGVMFGMSLLLEATTSHHRSFERNFTEPSRLVHIGAMALAFATWRVGRLSTAALPTLEALDAATTIVLCLCWAMLGVTLPRTEAVEFSMILATTYTVVARSVVVPSTFRRTLWISGAAVTPTAIVMGARGMGFAPTASERQVRTFMLFAVLWCGVAVITAALNSRQIYGLRAKISEIGKLGQYTLEQKLGEGGMGVVFRATHAMLRRPAAIKLLPPDRAGEHDLARFEREVQLTSRLAHPNTVSIFDFGRAADGTFYYVMEYLDGVDLERLVEVDGPLDGPRAIHILMQAAGALAEAHALGLVHRDIKPANIMLTTRADEPDVVKVVDFGLAKTVVREGDVGLSKENTITGTPTYLSPEAITTPDGVDAQSDLYALGAVAYFLLTGKVVFEGRTVIEVCTKHLVETPTSLSERAGKPIAADLEQLVLSCLAKPRDARPASAVALKEALAACSDRARYDVDAAKEWWRVHGATLQDRARAQDRRPSAIATMAIDLRGREGELA
ncbi:MAG: serine/threonine protein kinase [Myxococcales bacterium]|nr:serine/threonine protein kinase [Myxococcales bacterium]